MKPLSRIARDIIREENDFKTLCAIVRCFSNQSHFKIPLAEGESGEEEGSSLGLEAMRTEILERWVMLEC